LTPPALSFTIHILMAEIKDYIDPAVATYMRGVIADAGGNEVFFIGSCGEDRRVIRAETAARGDDESVPAVAQTAAVGDVVIHNHPTGVLSPSKPDIEIASMLGSRGVGFFIIDNTVTNIYAVVEPFAREVVRPLDEAEVVAAFADGGPINRAMSGFEARPGQLDMVRAVVTAFNDGKVAVLEGGTGVGKSMAYLVPALHWIFQNHERVVISTNTINLQQQLVDKDIPLMARAFPREFKAVLVKGRWNYICLRKLDLSLSEPEFLLDEGEKGALNGIAAWAVKTKEGSRSDLTFAPGEELWERVSSESDTCTRIKCPHFTHCFFFRARREAASADLLVVNHHILLADIAIRGATGGSDMAILPGYSRLIIDEGHNLEDGATSYFGNRVSRLGLLKMLGRLHSRRDRERGALPFLHSKLKGRKGALRDKGAGWQSTISGRILAEKEAASQRVEEAFDALYNFSLGQVKNEAGELKLRLTDKLRAEEGWPDVEAAFGRLGLDIGRLVRSLKSLGQELAEEGLSDGLSDALIEMKSLADRLEATAGVLDGLLKGESDGLVRWVEAPARKAGRVVTICGSPLNVAAEIKGRIYDRLKTVVVTSATLTVKKKFDYIGSRIGLDLLPKEQLITGVFPSPFDYKNQMIIGVPKDVPAPSDRDFGAALHSLVRDSLVASNGRAFVLFTSFRLLNQVFSSLEEDLSDLGITPMKQGATSRHKMLEDFRNHTSAALFGTDSFWEGVDVAGEALSNVIITKLPFSVPDDPVIEARQEEITAAGGNPFMEYVVPQAVIKFRQGFGRLIRSKSDRGCILVFDRRMVEKNYGREFLDSLPEGRLVVGPKVVVFEQVREFFHKEDT